MTNRLMFSPNYNSKSLLLLAAMLLAIAGCKPSPQVTTHRVAKARSGLEALNGSTTSNAMAPVQAATDRMIVGLYELSDSTWFFKINGSLEQVAAAEPVWKPFLEQVRFNAGKPAWDLPAGWIVADEKPMRFATLLMDQSASPLELAISQLGPQQDLVLNANRWLGQMGLAPITKADLETCVTPLKNESAAAAWLFDAQGVSSGGMAPFANRGAAPFMNQLASDPAPSVAIDAAPTGAEPALNFTPPDDWEAGATSMMVTARFKKTVGDKSAQITVIQMPADANEWEPNAVRWAGEVGQASMTTEQLQALTSEITIDGQPGQQLTLVDESNESNKGTIAVMVKEQGIAWFLKLTGDRELVKENEAVFSKFIQSITF